MQINTATGEVYAMCKAKAAGEELELVTLTPRYYSVVCWHTEDDEVRWCRDFGSDLAAAITEYNRWASVPEAMPHCLCN